MLQGSFLGKRALVFTLLAFVLLLGAAWGQTETAINCGDGENPSAGVILDQGGNLYGTASQSGVYGGGVVFRITPTGKYTVLHSFYCHDSGICPGGSYPLGLAFDQKGNLYGAAFQGGSHVGGVVFKITPAGEYSVVYSFCAQDFPICSDGADPTAVVFGQSGNLYGTAAGGGGDPGGGVVFKITP